MARTQQLGFIGLGFQKPRLSFGGDLLKNSHAKIKRPLDSKLPIHLVLKATKSTMRLPKNFGVVNQAVAQVCRKHGVLKYEYANVGNHLHMIIKIPRRSAWAAFIRELTGRIAYRLNLKWAKLPFTRLVAGWKKAFKAAKEYVQINAMEADGHATRAEIKFIRSLDEFWLAQ